MKRTGVHGWVGAAAAVWVGWGMAVTSPGLARPMTGLDPTAAVQSDGLPASTGPPAIKTAGPGSRTGNGGAALAGGTGAVPGGNPGAMGAGGVPGLTGSILAGMGSGLIATGPSVPGPPSAVVTTADDLVAALAAAHPGDWILVPDETEIDLSSYTAIVIPAGVTLQGERGGRNKGALLYSNRQDDFHLFEAGGDGARLIGLRLQGPSGRPDENQPESVGILLHADTKATVQGCELYNWTEAAVSVKGSDATEDPCGPNDHRRADEPYVMANFIHDNQKQNKGYGVEVSYGAFPLIQENTFTQNRHSISGDGRVQTSYRAYDNLVLTGGYAYCRNLGPTVGVCWDEQEFDMHGRANQESRLFIGGIAGEYMDIGWNTFRGTQQTGGVYTRPAFSLRGTPCDEADFHDNVLEHSPNDGVVDFGTKPVFEWNDQFNVDTSYEIGVADLDGDGRDDLFLATGTGWFYSSAAEAPWTFLQRRPERLAALHLADFDGDGRADVFTTTGTEWLVSYQGRTPWVHLNSMPDRIEDLRFGDFNDDGKTDVFKADGTTWYVSYSGTGPWVPINTSSYGVKDLSFGDFNDDGRTDVFAVANGQWSVSWGGTSPWQRLNEQLPMYSTPVFADIDGDGRTDILVSQDIRLVGNVVEHRWLVSWSGSFEWAILRDVVEGPFIGGDPYSGLADHWFGRFDDTPGEDALRFEVTPDPYDRQHLQRLPGATGSYVWQSPYAMR